MLRRCALLSRQGAKGARKGGEKKKRKEEREREASKKFNFSIGLRGLQRKIFAAGGEKKPIQKKGKIFWTPYAAR
jgi:hypothetical protein